MPGSATKSGLGVPFRFRNRNEAGRCLAASLTHLRDEKPVVLALPRGGVAVAVEVAGAFHAPLDIVLVRKICAPFQPELAVGAIADGGHVETVINPDVAAFVSEAWIGKETIRQLREIERRRAVYVGDRPRVPVAGRTAILVDDGIATGATMRAALRSVRRANPKRLVLAVPVAPPDIVSELRAEADEVVCLQVPHSFGAIGAFYEDFHQLDDAEVIRLLDEASGPCPPRHRIMRRER
ncbi:phosphoribosyltransferase [Azospirillum brasilense]|uniref:Phosphoribosyltransferase n=1 Tax=Azospirillum brasilense TaxID=192 RepID=A0A6L3AQR8_AZOBR|nr:phosphoribosyltransferase [Azospirillum brasilense]